MSIFIRGGGAYPEEVLVQDQATLDRFLNLEAKHNGEQSWTVIPGGAHQGRTPFKVLTASHVTRLEKMDQDNYFEFLVRNNFMME
jgi:hypothetical protein